LTFNPLQKKFHQMALAVFFLLTVCNANGQRKKNTPDNPTGSARLREAEFFFTEAQKFYILEDYAKALLYFQRVADLNPTSATVHYKIAEILSKSTKEDDLAKAANHIDLALKYDNKNKYFYLLASNIYGGLGQFNKATQALETMMKEVSGTEEYLYELAALYLFDKKEDEALKVYDRAETLLGIDETSSLQKQQIYLGRGKIQEAMREGEKLLSAFPDEERYVVGFAETMSRYGQVQKAIDVVENFLKEHPDAGNSKMLLAGLYRDSGQEEKSRNYILQMMDDASVDVNSKVLMLNVYVNTVSNNRSKKITDRPLEDFAVALFQKLETNHPRDPNVQLMGGNLYFTVEQEDDAKVHYLKAVRAGTTSFEAWQNLMYLESQSNQADSLLKHSDEALELFPNQGMAYYFNGYAHVLKKNYREGAYALEQAKKLSQKNPEFIHEINAMLGDAYNGAKEYARSDAAYEEALAYNPNNDLVLNNYSYYLALRKENLEKAEKMSAQLIKLFPDNPAYLDTHAWVLYAREKYKEARKVIEKAVLTGTPSAVHLEHYGDILFQLGEIDLAVKQWQKAKQKNGDNAALDKKIENRKLN
jgi:tetratricopeptide (TPR) repeat protein